MRIKLIYSFCCDKKIDIFAVITKKEETKLWFGPHACTKFFSRLSLPNR